MTAYEAALALADAAIPVFPCAADKAPLTAHGFRDATIDPQPADFARAALVGVPTGAASGFDVIDVDPRHGGDVWLARHEHRLPVTRRVRTRSGGVHLYLRARPGMRCSTSKIAPGVDVRAEGGFVIAWDTTAAGELAEWPEWLAEAATVGRTRHDTSTRTLDAPPNAESVVSLLDRMPNPETVTRDDYVRVMLAAKGCIDALDGAGEADIAEAAIGWAARWPESPGEDAERTKWQDDFATRDAPLAGWPNLLAVANRLGVDTVELRAASATEFASLPIPQATAPAIRRKLLRPADCEAGERRGYLVKHLVAPGDVAALIGAPGAGKSTLAPYLAYAVAQGREVFGLRTKPGPVLFVAAEDFSGMRQRVHALKLAHGDAPDFALTDCGNLTDSTARAELAETIRDVKPVLVVIDTIGAAWAGIDENDAAGMGAVVAVARSIARSGAAVLLVHHTAKNGDGTPRGHSVLNGTLDMCLRLDPPDAGVIRGALTKNRNGACDREIAFRLTARTLGTDEDGDAITAPIAVEFSASAGLARVRLSPVEQRACQMLATLGAASEPVTDEAWHAACEDQRLSTSPEAPNRRKIAAKVLKALIEKGRVSVSGGRFRLVSGGGAEDHDDSAWNYAEPIGTIEEPSGTTGARF